MIYDITVNGQIKPVNIEKTCVLRWNTDRKTEYFSVKIISDGFTYDSGKIYSDIPYYDYTGEFAPLKTYKCEITTYDGEKEYTATTVFRTALTQGFPKKCKWIGYKSIGIEEQNPLGNPATYICKEFDVDNVSETYLHVAGLGLFNVFINGKKVSDEVLSSPFTNYSKCVLYSNYNITEYLKIGKNKLLIVLGDGWFNQTPKDEWNFYKATWRDNAKTIFYVEGGVELYSDEECFASVNGKIRRSALRLGECFDNTVSETNFKKAIVMQSVEGELVSEEDFPIEETETIDYASYKKFENCVQFDFATSITGYVKLKTAYCGKIKIRYGDTLNDDGRIDNSSNGMYVYVGEFQTDEVICGGEITEYKPIFTYHAFRYVEIEGLNDGYVFTKDELKGIFIRSSFPKTGNFYCDNERLNTLYKLSVRSMECNFTGIPTDCPHREKNGWTGDMQLSSGAFIKTFNCAPNIYKWLTDIKNEQKESGIVPCIVPTASWGYTWGNGPAWDYALFALPFELYKQLNDTHAIKITYDTCKKYLDFLKTKEKDGLMEFGLGDWKPPKIYRDNVCPVLLTDSCYYMAMCENFSLFSKIVRNEEFATLYAKKAEMLKQAIRCKFLQNNGEDLDNISAISALIYFGVTNKNESEYLINKIEKLLKKVDYHCTYGILGAKYLHNVLGEYGRQDLFIKIMEKSDYPSFGYMIESGATTLWEEFEGTNSRNHHMYSDIASVFISYILGVNRVFENGKYKTVIKPYLDGFNKLKGCVPTPYGIIKASLVRDSGKTECELELPYGEEIELFLCGKKYILQGGKQKITVSE